MGGRISEMGVEGGLIFDVVPFCFSKRCRVSWIVLLDDQNVSHLVDRKIANGDVQREVDPYMVGPRSCSKDEGLVHLSAPIDAHDALGACNVSRNGDSCRCVGVFKVSPSSRAQEKAVSLNVAEVWLRGSYLVNEELSDVQSMRSTTLEIDLSIKRRARSQSGCDIIAGSKHGDCDVHFCCYVIVDAVTSHGHVVSFIIPSLNLNIVVRSQTCLINCTHSMVDTTFTLPSQCVM